MISSRSSTPVESAAAVKSTAKTISSAGSDSGYASTSNATDGLTTDHSQDFPDGVALPRRIFERKVTKLRLFDREVPQLTQHRFHDLHELFETPLCNHLVEAKINPYPISLKLKVLGESEATAKPWIVVLCNKAASKRVRHFFNQQHIKAVYQPPNPDSSQPSFEVFVCNRPPRPMAGTEVYGDFEQRSTMCGSIIKVGEGYDCRFATLGGVIKAIKPSGIVTLYGMTAGHILEPPGQYGLNQVDAPDEEDDEDEGFYSGEEEYELDDTLEGDEEAQDLATAVNSTETFAQSSQLGVSWPKIGSISATSDKGTKLEHDHDWALIKFDRVTDYQPNLLVLFDPKENVSRNRPLKENGKATEDGSRRKVFLLSGTGGVKTGVLSTSLSFLMMGPAKAFTKTYTLVLPHGSVLNTGDCGSWVVDQSTCEVYGHVVASDAMGDTYVVPLNATLQDMEESLGAAVFLPTEADIHTWLAQQAKASAEPITVRTKKLVAFHDSKPVPKLAGHSSSQASTSLKETSIPVIDHCNSCNAKFEGSPQDVRSRLLHHRRTCSKQNIQAAPGVQSPTSHVAKDYLDEWSKSSSVNSAKSVQQKATKDASTQQRSPVPWSIRSMYSNFRKNSNSSDSQQKEGSKVKSVGNVREKKAAGSASLTKLASTASSTSTAQDPKSHTKDSDSKKDWASSAISKKSPTSSSALAGKMSGDLTRAPIPGPKPSSSPTTIPSLPHVRQVGENLAPLPPRPAPPPVHGHESFHESSFGPRQQSHVSSSGLVSYEGYTFTRCKPQHTGQKETWAVAQMVPMPVSQKDLKAQTETKRKGHKSALDEYNDDKMKGFKRKQVDNLIRERTKVDGDYGYEYELASIKLESRKTKSKSTETLSMQVILKRQLIAGFPHESLAGPSMDFHAPIPSQVMDLTGGDELGKFGDNSRGSQDVGRRGADAPFIGHPGHMPFSISPRPAQPFSHGAQYVDNRPPLFHAAPDPLHAIHAPVQSMAQPPPFHRVPPNHQETYITQGHLGKTKKSKDKKAPQVVYTRHESRMERDSASSSSPSEHSFDLASDNSWAKTDATPDTVVSGQSREYLKDKHYRDKGKERPHQKDQIELTPSTYDIERPVYREHRRDEQTRSSLSPARRPSDVSLDSFELDLEHSDRRAASLRYSYGTRYRDHGHYEIEPAVSFPANRSSHHRGSSVSPERSSHRRASSYDFDRPLAHDSRALVPMYRRPTVYREPPQGFSRSFDPHDHAAEVRREQERWDRERVRSSSEAIVHAATERIRRREETIEREERDAREKRRRERLEMEERDAREKRRRERLEMEERDAREKSREMESIGRLESIREIERMKDVERMRIAQYERERWRREMTYDAGYMPRHRRDADYYY